METAKTLLALVVGGALSACGGGGGSSSTTNPVEPTKSITVLDGYLHNAVLFNDLNNNAIWEGNEPLLGLTDKNGQATIKSSGLVQVGAMTVVSGSPLSRLIAEKKPEWADLSSYDMDFPQEPIGQEFTLIGNSSSDVISPLTHLAKLSAQKLDIPFEQAYEKLTESLSEIEEEEIADDFVAAGQKKLHKFAQLITQTLANDDFDQHADTYLDNAVSAVKQMSDEQVNQLSYLPKLSNTAQGGFTENHKLRINGPLAASLNHETAKLNLQAGDTGLSYQFSLSDSDGELFHDEDRSSLGYSLSVRPENGTSQSLVVADQITLSLSEDMSTLNFEAAELLKGGQWTVYLNATDLDSQGSPLGTKSVPIHFKVSTDNELPVLDPRAEVLSILEVEAWQLVQGDAFSASLDYSALFSDPEADEIIYSWETTASAAGLELTEKDGTLTLSGTPLASQKGSEDRHTITIYASDKYHDEKASVALRLRHIQPPFEEATVGLEGPTWFYLLEDEESSGQTRIYCHAIRFSGGSVSQTLSGRESYENCASAASNMMNVGSYSFDSEGTLNYKLFYHSFSVPRYYAQRAQYGQAVAVRFSQKNKQHLTLFYSSAQEAEKRMQLDSDTTLDFTLIDENNNYSGAKAEVTLSQPGKFLLTFYRASDRRKLLTCDDLNDISSFSLKTASFFGGWSGCKDTINEQAVAPFFEDDINGGYAAIAKTYQRDSEKMMFSVK